MSRRAWLQFIQQSQVISKFAEASQAALSDRLTNVPSITLRSLVAEVHCLVDSLFGAFNPRKQRFRRLATVDDPLWKIVLRVFEYRFALRALDEFEDRRLGAHSQVHNVSYLTIGLSNLNALSIDSLTPGDGPAHPDHGFAGRLHPGFFSALFAVVHHPATGNPLELVDTGLLLF